MRIHPLAARAIQRSNFYTRLCDAASAVVQHSAQGGGIGEATRAGQVVRAARCGAWESSSRCAHKQRDAAGSDARGASAGGISRSRSGISRQQAARAAVVVARGGLQGGRALGLHTRPCGQLR